MGDPSRVAFEDLVYLCLEHHDEFDSSTKQSKGLTPGEVEHYRDKLYEERAASPPIPAPPDLEPAELRERPIDENYRPRFDVTIESTKRLLQDFQPEFLVKPVSGDVVGKLEWRLRGARFEMDWRQATVATLSRNRITERFDLSRPPQDDGVVGPNEMGFEIRFGWRGAWRVELHRWPISFRDAQGKTLVDVAREILPPSELDSDHFHTHVDYCEECGRVACNRCGYWYSLSNKCSRCGFIRSDE